MNSSGDSPILSWLEGLAVHLETVEKAVGEKHWDDLPGLLHGVEGLRRQLANRSEEIAARLQADPLFAAAYRPAHHRCREITERVIKDIQGWRDDQARKIVKTRNTLGQVHRYMQSGPEPAFYVDQTE